MDIISKMHWKETLTVNIVFAIIHLIRITGHSLIVDSNAYISLRKYVWLMVKVLRLHNFSLINSDFYARSGFPR